MLKTNQVTVIIYTLTCCEASGLAARAYVDSFSSTPFNQSINQKNI